MKRKSSSPTSDWAKFKFPGYDPYRDAGDCKLDKDAGNKAIDFFSSHLVHVKGPLTGKPFELMPWQQAIVGHLFGWKRKDGTRRYREAFIEIARKNGKSILGAGIALYTLFCDGEPGPEIYSAAGDRQQAGIVFEMSQLMVMANERLRDMAEVYRREIRYPKINGRFVVISSEAASKHGYNSHVVICDELHIWPNRELLDALITSTGARTQPLIISITTAGWDPHSIWHEKL